jgi:hypothetical protein
MTYTPPLLLWIALAALVAVFASYVKGRSGVGFFFLALVPSPVIAFWIALLVRTDRVAVARRRGLKQCQQCGGTFRVKRLFAAIVVALSSSEVAAFPLAMAVRLRLTIGFCSTQRRVSGSTADVTFLRPQTMNA